MDDPDSDSSERDQRLDELVTAYLKAQEAGQAPVRQALLDSNPELASELREFFADQDRLERLAAPLHPLADPIGPDGSSPPLPIQNGGETAPHLPPPPRSFGDYTILATVGQGGMGVVWKARQKRPDRLVALKMFRAGDLASPTDVQRFRNEAEVIAQFDHPHILPVYEVGEHDGVHYFSMKLVEGGSLADYLDSYRADPRAAARLLVTIARAVHYAHQRGVLHRDLKPSNILLDPHGEPHVSDFGLAKRVETDSSLTQSGALVGTPSYMAPEQAGGRKGAITTATDVYGLGAVLYALLTGRPPFQGETVLQTLEKVRELEPESPRRINPKVDRDLETICLKCLHKQPQSRYESAQALAEDLERWLTGEPIRARRAGWWERLLKWVRRHPTLAGLLLVSVLAVLGLLAGLFWHNAQLDEAARREHEQADLARHERDVAREERRLVRQAADDLYTQVAVEWLARQPRLEPVQRQFLEKALSFYQHIAEQGDADPSLQHETAKAYYRLGGIQLKLGKPAEAQASFRKAIPFFEQLVAEFPDDDAHLNGLASSYDELGKALQGAGRTKEAGQAYRDCISWRRKQVECFPQRLDYQRSLGAAQQNLAMIHADAGNLSEAQRAYDEAQTILRHVVKAAPRNPEYRLTLALLQGNLGNLLLNTGRAKEAEPVYREAIAALEKLAKEAPRESEYRERWAYLLSNLAITLQRMGRHRESPPLLNQAIALQEQLVKDHPAVPDYTMELASSRGNLAIMLRALGKYEAAEQCYHSAIDAYQTLVARFPDVPDYRRHMALIEGNRGNLLGENLGRPREAEEACRRAITIQQKLVSDFPKNTQHQEDLANSYHRLATRIRDSGRFREQEELVNQALNLQEKLLAASPRNQNYQLGVSRTSTALAWLHVWTQGPPCPRADRADALAKRAVQLNPKGGTSWFILAVAHYRVGSWKDCLAALEKARQLGYTHISGVWFFVMAQFQLGNKEMARQSFADAVKWMEKNHPQDKNLLRFRAEAAKLLGIQEKPQGKDSPRTDAK